MVNREEEMIELLQEARPLMESKCCHFDWCIERRGIEGADEQEGFTDIEDGMHPGCAPYRYWLDRCDAVLEVGS